METRKRILETAARLFHRQGFAATGVAAILRETGINSGSLYHFFPGKEALLKGVLEWYLEESYPRVLAPIEQQEPDPLERIFRLLDWYRSFLLENGCGLGCPVGNLALEISDTHPELRTWVDRNFENWKAHLKRWLDEGRDRLPPDCDTDQLASFLLSVKEGSIMQVRVAGSLAPLDDSVRQLRIYFDSLQRDAEKQGLAEPLARSA